MTDITGDTTGVIEGRVVRIDRGWSTVETGAAEPLRVRNLGVDVAVGDMVTVSADGERIETIRERRSALTRRASFEGARGRHQVVASNIDVVLLVHSLTVEVNVRRLERELVLAYDSGAEPVVVLTKSDAASTAAVADALATVGRIARGVRTAVVSAVTGEGLESVRQLAGDGRTVGLLGASGVGKSTLVNALVGTDVQRTGDVREDDQRGRHTTVAAELVALPTGGWLLDTPGLRAVNLWTSGRGIELAFRDVFELADDCRFRDCKHMDEPGCAVNAAIDAGSLPRERLESMRTLVAEEASIEEEQTERRRAADRRGVRRPRDGGG